MTMYEFEVTYYEADSAEPIEIAFQIKSPEFQDAWKKAVEKAFAYAGNAEISSITVVSMYNLDI